jgi:hypothetical protein
MEHLNLFVAQIAVIFLPGIVWARLDARYAAKEKRSDLDFFVAAFIFGVVAYAVTFALYGLQKQPFALVDFKDAEDKTVLTQRIGQEIIAATGVGFVLAILWVYASTWKLLTRFLQFIRATKRYGDEDVWDFTFNAPGPSSRFVNVRDFDKKIVYSGRVNAFSETGKLRELTLFDVELYDFEGQYIYSVPHLYLARKPEDIHIEFPLP